LQRAVFMIDKYWLRFLEALSSLKRFRLIQKVCAVFNRKSFLNNDLLETMNNPWYAEVSANTKITQGDLVFDCPVLEWAGSVTEESLSKDGLKGLTEAILADVIVMTQSCDLEQDKVDNVIVCPHFSLSKFKENWEKAKRAQKENPTTKAWKSYCDDICDGYFWHLSMLNCKEDGELKLECRIVDFHYVYSLPVEFLQSLVQAKKVKRLTLLPPYREHLSQAFARFFMRVGLPVNIIKTWG
jgi:hypothetical protein